MSKQKNNQFEFKEVIGETDKARHILMNGGNKLWLPKKCCPITGCFVTIPKWLQIQMMEGVSKKIKRDSQQFKLEFV